MANDDAQYYHKKWAEEKYRIDRAEEKKKRLKQAIEQLESRKDDLNGIRQNQLEKALDGARFKGEARGRMDYIIEGAIAFLMSVNNESGAIGGVIRQMKNELPSASETDTSNLRYYWSMYQIKRTVSEIQGKSFTIEF